MALAYHQVLALGGGVATVVVALLLLLLLLRRHWSAIKTRCLMALSSGGGGRERHSISASVCSKDALLYGSAGSRPSLVSTDTRRSTDSLMVRSQFTPPTRCVSGQQPASERASTFTIYRPIGLGERWAASVVSVVGVRGR
uniref:Uncharacterized protein n=1 Tax=Plectus sambesii TaxID=2011161 RepID=A0A914X518_9BILA